MSPVGTLRNRQHITLLAAVIMLSLASIACEPPEPHYRIKDPTGLDTISHFDDMSDQPKWMRFRRGDIDKRKAIAERREHRDKARGIYRKDSPWDF